MQKYKIWIFIIAGLFLLAVSSEAETLGNGATDRSILDTAVNINFIDHSLVFAQAGKVTSWQIYGQRAGSLIFQVYRLVSGNTYMLVGENAVTTTASGLQSFAIAQEQQISFLAGDKIGWRFGATAGVIDFNMGGPTVAWVHITNNILVGQNAVFGTLDNRTYSIQATFENTIVPEPSSLVLGLLTMFFLGTGFCFPHAFRHDCKKMR